MRRTDQSTNIGLAVAQYDAIDGLLAGYEARNGERVLLLAAHNDKGHVNARMLYLDAETGNILPAMTFALVGTGKEAQVVILAGGVDVLDALRVLREDSSARISSRKTLSRFMNSDIGQAALEAIPVLYAELEPIDRNDAELARLKAPFGAIRMAMELTAGTYVGLPEANEIFGAQRHSVMQTACPDHLCQLRTAQFTIHANGLFDVLTDMDTALSCLAAKRDNEPLGLRYSNDCFGCCGPGCWGCTGIYNDECSGHDQCVCEAGHLACIFGSPSGCGTNCGAIGGDNQAGYCNSLISAIIGFLRDLFGFGGGGDGVYVPPPWPDAPCFTIAGCNDCMGSPYCVPQFPEFPH